jgi:hypothetical protein
VDQDNMRMYNFTKDSDHLHRCQACRFQFRVSSQNVSAQRIPRAGFLSGGKQYETSIATERTSSYDIRLGVKENGEIENVFRTIGFTYLE